MFTQLEHDALVGFAASLVGDDAAEDVVQDTYVKFLSGKVLPTRQPSHFNFVLQIVKYTAFRWLEQERRLHSRRFRVWQLIDSHTVHPRYEEVLDAKRLLRRLNRQEQLVLRLMGEDPSYRAVAAILGITPDAVRGRTYRARQRLKEQTA